MIDSEIQVGGSLDRIFGYQVEYEALRLASFGTHARLTHSMLKELWIFYRRSLWPKSCDCFSGIKRDGHLTIVGSGAKLPSGNVEDIFNIILDSEIIGAEGFWRESEESKVEGWGRRVLMWDLHFLRAMDKASIGRPEGIVKRGEVMLLTIKTLARSVRRMLTIIYSVSHSTR